MRRRQGNVRAGIINLSQRAVRNLRGVGALSPRLRTFIEVGRDLAADLRDNLSDCP